MGYHLFCRYFDSQVILDLISRASSHCVLLTCLHDSLGNFLVIMAPGTILVCHLNLYFPSPRSGISYFSKELVGVFFVGCTFWFMPLGLPVALGTFSSVFIFCSGCVPRELSRGLYIVKICVFTDHLFFLLTGILP